MTSINFTPRTRLVNPRLGTYFSIFASAFTALILLLLIFEQLDTPPALLRAAMLLVPLAFYAGIGWASFTRDPFEYFASGRRVPAIYTGLALAMTAFGGTGLVTLTGVFFLVGFDALCMVTGGLSGFVAMAVLLAPFLRKFGSFTVPSYLGRRFGSPALRITAAAILSVPLLLLLAAEIRTGALIASGLSDVPLPAMAAFSGFAIVLISLPGGLRSVTWAGTAKLIAGLLALLAPAAIIAALYTNLPIPQLTTGPLLRSLLRREAVAGLEAGSTAPFQFNLPGEGFAALVKPFATAFGSVGPAAYMAAALTVMAGVAAAPWLLPRAAATPSIHMARKSLGWAAFGFGVIMLTLAAIGIFMRNFVMGFAVDGTLPPAWFKTLEALHYVAVQGDTALPALRDLTFSRDHVLFSLPVAAGMPQTMLLLALGGAFAVALAGAASAALSLGNIVTEDIVNGLSWTPPPTRLWQARLAFAVCAAFGTLLALAAPADPFKLLLWALILTGSSAFPVLVLSIWWKGLNTFGALAGMICGFGVTIFAILTDAAGLLPFDSALSGLFGLPAAALAALFASLFTPPPSPHSLELLYEIRTSSGENLASRDLRRARPPQNPQE